MKNWFSRLICRHEYKERKGLLWFFGKMECKKCGELRDDPNAVMTTTHFSARIITDPPTTTEEG